MLRISSSVLCGILLFLSGAVYSDITVSFIEGAPKDRFAIRNTGECPFKDLTLNVDLSSSTGNLIFDTTGSGAGVEVFQPFETDDGIELVSSAMVQDGDKQLTIKVAELAPDTTVSFTIDVDDTLTNSELGQIRVGNSEIAGTQITVVSDNNPAATATIDNSSNTVVVMPDC